MQRIVSRIWISCKSLAGILGNQDVVNQLIEAKDESEIITILKEND